MTLITLSPYYLPIFRTIGVRIENLPSHSIRVTAITEISYLPWRLCPRDSEIESCCYLGSQKKKVRYPNAIGKNGCPKYLGECSQTASAPS